MALMKEATIQLIQAVGCKFARERPTARGRGAHGQLPNNAAGNLSATTPSAMQANSGFTLGPGTQILMPSDPDVSDSPTLH